jgi:hypothetical protein
MGKPGSISNDVIMEKYAFAALSGYGFAKVLLVEDN